ncbi:MAG: DNA polymerase domain-containing protein [Candidatus Colwellbacteria bacterium]|nr:DNA polymerase domain-containing protein [Candidatus Colwellbacteria bacterium]
MSVTGKPSKGELDFFAYQWSVEEDNESTMIRCYGVTKENKNVYVRIDNFTPYCYVELPTNIDWTESRIELVSNKLSNLNRKIYQPIRKEFVMRRKLYYAWKEKRKEKKKKIGIDGKPEEGKGSVSMPYKDKLFPFLFLAFRSSSALRNFTYSMKKDVDIPGLGRIKFNLHEHEAGISPVLKLQALKKLPAAGMIRVKGIHIPDADKESTCDYEISCSYDNLFPIDTSEIIEPKVLSFDIEANSTITSAMPDASRPNDKVFQIGFATLINKVRKKLLFSLGNPDPKKVGLDVELRTFKTEADLLVSLTDYIHEGKFTIIIGYNILGWDFQYMISRAKYTKCFSEFDMMGTLMGKHAAEVAPQFESKAFNAQKLVYLDAEGRLFLDLLPIIKRGGEKLTNYRLGTVLEHFKLPSKDPLTARDIFRCYREFTPESLGEVGKYCIQDAYATLLLYEKMQTWFGMCEMAKTAHVPIFYLFSKGTQIQMFSQVMEYCMYNNYVIISNGYVMKDGDEYMGAIVLTPVPGKYKKVISFDFASLYPSIIMAHNIDYATLIPEGELYMVDTYDTEIYLTEWRQFPCFVKMSSIDMFTPSKNIEEWGTVRNRSELQTKVEAMKEKYPGKLVGIFADKSEIPDEHCHVFCWADHHNCIVEGTPVSLGSHSVPIEKLVDNKEKVMSWNEQKNGLEYSDQTRFYDQGVKECIEFFMEDGTSMKCTPDHRFLTSENKWVEAKNFNIGVDRIKIGVNPPVRDYEQEMKDCYGWYLQIGSYKFKTDTLHEYQRLLKFTRLLGLVLTDGSVASNRVTVFLGHSIDVDNVLNDIEFLTGIRPAANRGHSSWTIGIPLIISQYMLVMSGVVIGKRTTCPGDIPHFLKDENCPLPIIKEFLSGLFSGDGHTPCYNNSNKQLTSLAFAQSKEEKYVESGIYMMECIKTLLGRFDISVIINKPILTKDTGNYCIKFQVITEDIIKYHDNIGFYYCVHKNQRLSAAVSYFKLRNNVWNQREEVTNKVKILRDSGVKLSKAVEIIHKKMREEYPIYNEYYSLPSKSVIADRLKPTTIAKTKNAKITFAHKYFPSTYEYLASIDALKFFTSDKEGVTYGVDFEEDVLPTYNLKVVFSKSIGMKKVYDIEVKDNHSFIANGLVTHNCIHDMNRKRLKNGEFSKSKAMKVICGQRYYRFIKEEYGGKGVVPTILASLISRRKQTRAEIKTNSKEIKDKLISLIKNGGNSAKKFLKEYEEREKDFFCDIDNDVEKEKEENIDVKQCIERIEFLDMTNRILDKRQASYKVCANSMYGAMGVKKGYLPLLPGASSVTYKGRCSIEFISTHIPEKYNGVTVYGDTDSSHIYFPHIKNNQDAVDLAEKIVKEIQVFFPLPMKLEFEKIYEKYIILTKKRYMARVANKKGEIIEFIKKGVMLSRRDNCEFARKMYLKASESLLDDVDEYTILNDVIDGINSLFERKYGFKSFVITKSMGRAVYKMKTLPAHVQLAYKMRSRGIEVPVGARIEYLFTTRCMGEKKFAQGDKVEDLDYFAQWRRYLRVDYLYYLEKQLIKPLDELLEVGLGIKNFVKNQYELRMNKWRIMERIKELAMPEITIEGEEEEIVPVKKAGLKKSVIKKSPVKKTDHDKPKKKRARKIAEIILDSDDEEYDIVEKSSPKVEIIMEEDSDDEEVDVREKWAWFSSENQA